LHIEDKLIAIERRARKVQIERRLVRHVEITAAPTGGGIRRVHPEQRRRSAACGNEKRASRERKTPRMLVGLLERNSARVVMQRRERNRRELAVGRRVELDRQPRAVGIVAITHRWSGRVARPSYCSLISPSNFTLILSPGTSSVTCAGNVSVPRIAPSSTAWSTER